MRLPRLVGFEVVRSERGLDLFEYSSGEAGVGEGGKGGAPPSAASNGTSLQLRITPPASAAGWGATVWLDQVSVTPR